MLKFIFYILLGYVLYRFITGFVIPVFKAGGQIKKQFNEMQQRMQDQMERENTSASFRSPSSHNPPKSTHKADEGEYIDFEEVK
ncbi:MAG: DUF4834 family protein [Chitinophagaceae bacterium]|nr:DUF4834 family protein [Chitinophagaceae bacterium]